MMLIRNVFGGSLATKKKDSNKSVSITGVFSWWLSKKRPFIIDGKYKLELEFIDMSHMSARIKITNLETQEVTTHEQDT